MNPESINSGWEGVKNVEKIVIGFTIDKERGLLAASNLEQVVPVIAGIVQRGYPGGQGKAAGEEFVNDIMLACIALGYVAEFAVEQCRIIPIPDNQE